jgi:hypothetical protein
VKPPEIQAILSAKRGTQLFRLASIVAICLMLAPAAAFAQASIAGVVKDTSGAVVPGVTVEASSPALIEKTGSVVTDGTGQYKIIELKPGTYSVTFTLGGFSTVKREGVELAGSFVATINADMRVGAVAETVSVTGETPLIDVQSSAVQRVVTKEVIDAIPTGRFGVNLAALQPGMISGGGSGTGALSANVNLLTTQDVGGTAGDTLSALSIHGGKGSEQRTTIAACRPRPSSDTATSSAPRPALRRCRRCRSTARAPTRRSPLVACG